MVGGEHYFALKYTDFIFLMVRIAVMDVSFFLFFSFFFFREKIDIPGHV